MKVVSIYKGEDRYKNIRESLANLHSEITPSIPKEGVIIKPNFVDVRYPLACTHPVAVKAVVDHLKELGVSSVFIAEESSVGKTVEALENFGYRDVFKGYTWVELVAIEELPEDINPLVPIEIYKWDRTIQTIYLNGFLVNAPYLISVGPPKTHDTVIVTLSVKNIAMALPKGRNKGKVHQGYGIININIALLARRRLPDLAIIDGTVGMEGDGPVYGTAKEWGVVLSSHNIVELDSATTYGMGYAPTEIGYLYALYKMGVGDIYFRDVKFVGLSMEDVKTSFKPHREYSLMKRWYDSAYGELLGRLTAQ